MKKVYSFYPGTPTKKAQSKLAYRKSPGFHLFKTKDGKYWFHVEAKNGRILVASEIYERKAGAINGMKSLVAALSRDFPMNQMNVVDHTGILLVNQYINL